MSLIPKVFDSIEAAATGSNNSLFDDSYHTIDVEIFLEINRLSSVKETFLSRNITIEELLDFSEPDLRSFATDIGLDTLLSNRLVKAIRDYQPQNMIAVQDAIPADVHSMIVEADGNMDGNEAVQHVVISSEENDCINNINRRFDHTSMLVTTIESSFVTADEACKQCKQEISDKFQHLFLQMKLREEELIAEADDLCNNKKSRLEKQKLSLNEYKILINNSKQEYEKLITNANLDVNNRKQEVLNMFSAVMTTNVSMSIVTQPNLAFKCNPMDIQHFLSALMIDNCDRPSSPILIVNGVTYNTIDIEWKTEFDDQMFDSEQLLMYDRQPTEYQICFCKYRKVYSVEPTKKKRKKGNKKKKKKKQRKGRKKKRRYSDSESESESDSSSESSSDSISSSDDSSSSSHTYYSSTEMENNNFQSAGIANEMKVNLELQEGIGNNNVNERASVNYARKLEHMHWKKILVKSVKKRQITIRKLYHGWLYFIRIRAKNNSGWSDFSLPIKIATQTINLCWDTNHHGRGVTFLDENLIKFSSRQSKAVVDYRIKLRHHKIFVWEFKLERICNHIWIGFVHGPAKRNVQNWNSFLGGNNHNERSIGFGKGAMSVSVQNIGGHNHQQSVPLQKKVKNGDRFRFKCNMKSRTCSVYHNSHMIGILFQNIFTCVVPAASNSSGHSQVSVRFAK